MSVKVAVFHAYSSHNSGDGLLVEHTLALLRRVLGTNTEVTLCASYPESFSDLGVTTLRTKPNLRGYEGRYVEFLRKDLSEMDLIIGVGGGYLRAPGGTTSAKSALVMLPQLRYAAKSEVPSIYMPQSVGPLRGPVGVAIRRWLNDVDVVHLRDDRSMAEVKVTGTTRTPDLAILLMNRPAGTRDVAPVCVLNVRRHRGELVPKNVRALGEMLGRFDGLVQSSVGGNDDRQAVASLGPRETLDRAALYGPSVGEPSRVVVAMRLHSALQAIDAGHYVVHLAYERKGFGAFDDLGLTEFVHAVGAFDLNAVRQQVLSLLHDPDARRRYDGQISRSSDRNKVAAQRLEGDLSRLAFRRGH